MMSLGLTNLLKQNLHIAILKLLIEVVEVAMDT